MHDIKKTGGFSSAGEFFVAVRKYLDGAHQDGRLDTLRKAALTEGTDSGGGFTVPQEWAQPIYAAALENSIVRRRAIVLPMKSDVLNVKVLIDSDRSASIFGGVTMTWTGEGADSYATTVVPAIGNVGLHANKATATCFSQNDLEQDYDALASFITLAFGQAIAFEEDDLFINGSGVGKPLGILNSSALIGVARATNGAAIDGADLGKMAARLLPGSWATAVWLVNQSVLANWANVATSGGNAFGIIDLASMTIMGRPIIVTEHAVASGAFGDVVLADFSQYVIGDRELIIASSRQATYSSNAYGWFQDQTLWRLTLRVDGKPLLPAAITPKRGGDTVSPFVATTTAS